MSVHNPRSPPVVVDDAPDTCRQITETEDLFDLVVRERRIQCFRAASRIFKVSANRTVQLASHHSLFEIAAWNTNAIPSKANARDLTVVDCFVDRRSRLSKKRSHL